MKRKILFIGIVGCISFATTLLAQVPTNGQVAYYPFNGSANDASGNNINGVVTNATPAPDRFGTPNAAYYFNGTNSQISITHNSANIDLTNTFSINFWYKAYQGFNSRAGLFYTRENALGNDQGGIGVDYASDNSLDSAIQVYKPTYLPGDITLQMGHANPAHLPTNVWHNITIVYTENVKGYLYFDCVLTDSSQALTTFYTASSPIRIGAVYNSIWTYFFKGWIDDIRIYNRALSPAEVNSFCNEGICYQNVTVTDTLIINTNISGFNPVTYQNAIKIFPNPTNDHIIIDNGNFTSYAGYTIKITNSLGQTVFTNLINQQQFSVDLSTWSGNGIYFVHIINGQSNTIDIRKVVLQ